MLFRIGEAEVQPCTVPPGLHGLHGPQARNVQRNGWPASGHLAERFRGLGSGWVSGIFNIFPNGFNKGPYILIFFKGL